MNSILSLMWAGYVEAMRHNPKGHAMYEITKDFHFSYSHRLNGLAADHPCSRLHGHNAIVRLHLTSEELDAVGFVVDYRATDAFKRWLDQTFDHRHINDVVPFNPTSEKLCQFVYEKAREMGLPAVAISWSETPKTWATFRPKES